MCRLKAWILALLLDRDQLFFKQRHHIYGVLYMFGLAMLYDGKVDEGFRHIVSDQLRPYFLLDIFRLVGMKIAQADGIFEFAERSFYGPSGRIEKLYTFRWKFIRRQVCHNTFKRAVRNREPYNTEGQVVSVQGAIRDIVKGSPPVFCLVKF